MFWREAILIRVSEASEQIIFKLRFPFRFMDGKKELLLENFRRKDFSKPIIKAFENVPREKFVPKEWIKHAYDDTSLPIGFGQTISQPSTIAIMLSLLELERGMKVLELGSGCGYVLALLSKIVGSKGKVYGVERIKQLYEKSKRDLSDYKNISVYNKNGADGLREKAPFDRILVSAAMKDIPRNLAKQLKAKGIIVFPLGNNYEQSLFSYQKFKREIRLKHEIPGFAFVPFVSGEK